MKKLLLKNFLSPGDIVMLTAAVRDLHLCHPRSFVTDVRTSCPAFWENNPYLSPLDEKDPEVQVIDCEYPLINRSNETPYHCLHGFMEFLNERLGLRIKPTAFHGDIHLSDLEKSWYSQVHELTGEDTPFWIIVAGGKFDVTIKWWSTARFQEVVDHFRGRIQFVQVGETHHHHPALKGVIDLRGKTDLRQFVRLMYHAQGVLSPVTCAMHLAAAVERKDTGGHDRPCVVVAGSREPPHWEAYPSHQYIHTVGALPCDHGGCWKARTVPLKDGDERDQAHSLCEDVIGDLPHCMDLITSAEVIRRIEFYLNGGAAKALTSEQVQAAERGVERSLTAGPGHAWQILGNGHGEANGAGAKRPVPKQKASRMVLIQQACGYHTELLDLSLETHRAYAARHGLAFWPVWGQVQEGRVPIWNKIVLIRHALEMGFDEVLWLDADTLVVRPEVDPRGAIRPGPPVGLCRHPQHLGDQPWHFNVGVIAVRNCNLAVQYFERVWHAGPTEHHWEEQVRMNEMARALPESVQLLANRWNCTEGVNPCRNPVIRAWHGYGRDAIQAMKTALAEMAHTTSNGNARSAQKPRIETQRGRTKDRRRLMIPERSRRK